MNHKVDDLTTSAKRAWVLRFGGDKAANDMSVGHIKAIYGKQVKEGKLTIEDKANVKVLIQALPAECARLMKTLTTLKGQAPAQQKVFLATLGCCVKCEAKVAQHKAKFEEKQRKLITAQLEQAEHELAKKRKRESAIEKYTWRTHYTEIGGGEEMQEIRYKEYAEIDGFAWQLKIRIEKDIYKDQSSAIVELFSDGEWKLLDDIMSCNMQTEHTYKKGLTPSHVKEDRDTLVKRARLILM